jgi:beta-glucosidase
MFPLQSDRRTVLLGGLGALALLRTPAYAQGSARAPDSRIERLIAGMTLEEKAGQLTVVPAAQASAPATAVNPAAVAGTVEEQAQRVREGRLGSVFNGGSADWHRRMQRVAVEESRLKIPMLFGADVIHGFRTIFPVPLAEAASFDPDLAERTARAAAEEATAVGLAWNFAPMVDIARDARWGRGVEGAGEDVLLGKRFSAARVRGFQGKRGLADRQAMLATPKHLAAYGAAVAGLDYNTVDLSERTLRETYFPPFQAGFDAGALSTMASFNEINGVPAHGNPWLLRDVLRGEWGFEGFVVSDYTGDLEMIAHGFARDERDATRIAIMAGVDMSMASDLYAKHLPDLVRSGEVPMRVVDEAVRRVLLLKDRLGLFADPFNRLDPRHVERDDRPKNRPLARESARASVVMLRNDGVLPLPKRGRRIALVGPFAEGPHHLNGPWVLFGKPEYAVSIADAMRGVVGRENLTVTPGSEVEAPLPGGIDAAVAAARAADVVVMVLGEAERMSGEAQSRASITVPAAQQALAEAVSAVGKPMVVLLKNGRALVLEGAVASANAVLVTWFLGAETGTAIADLLFGDHSPSGRLPISFPHATGQAPYHYDHKRTGRPTVTNQPGEEFKARFREFLNDAAYPFGHGLTYGEFVYEGLEVAGGGRLSWDGEIRVAATVRNVGRRESTETVQLYVHDRVASVTRPVRELKGWERVTLRPGQSRRVSFTLRRADLQFVGLDLKWTAEPGMFDVWIAPNAQAGLKGEFELLRS